VTTGRARPGSIDLARYRRVVALTGAGISVASGLRPYRGPGGLWEEGDTAKSADAEALARDPRSVWKLFGGMRAVARAARPSAAHEALARAEQVVGGALTILTQNVDGLHQRAGSSRVVEIHGSLFRTRCTRCDAPAFADESPHDEVPACAACGALLRPDVVLFGEPLPVDAEWHAKHALRDCDLFLAIGTSGTVDPAARFVRWAEFEGARTVLVNLEPMTPPSAAFREQVLGPADEVVPGLLGV